MKFQRHGSGAFTLIDLLVVILLAMALLVCAVPLAKERKHSPLQPCMSNLKQIGIAWSMYTADNKDLFPWAANPDSLTPAASQFSYIHGYLGEGTKVLICPVDQRAIGQSYSNLTDANLSYFTGVHDRSSQPEGGQWSFLAGDRNLNGGKWQGMLMKFDSSSALHWTNGLHYASGQPPLGNVLFRDGHVDTLSDDRLRKAIKPADVNTQRVLFPR